MPSSMLWEDIEDFVDVRATLGRWTAGLGTCSPLALVDAYERSVEQLADLEMEAAVALNVPHLVGAAHTHTEATRRLAGAYCRLARTVLCS